MKILITGKKDKLWKAVGEALSRQTGLSVSLIPASSQVIEALRSSPPLDAVLYTISHIDDIELLRWVLKINPSVPLIAVVPTRDARLRKEIQDEGAANVVEVTALGSTQIRSTLAPVLGKLRSASGTETRQQISDDLHAIRSALTGILGNAEMALKRTSKAAANRVQLEEIPRGVTEIEHILRRLHRTVRSRPLETPPGSLDRRSKR